MNRVWSLVTLTWTFIEAVILWAYLLLICAGIGSICIGVITVYGGVMTEFLLNLCGIHSGPLPYIVCAVIATVGLYMYAVREFSDIPCKKRTVQPSTRRNCEEY